jgi:hypothetical protein
MYTLLYASKLNCQFNVVTHLGTVMDLTEEIANKLKRNNVLLAAPMGWGKTTLMLRLAVLLAKEGWRVGVVAPTLTLLVKKWPQLLEMLQRELNPPRVMLSAGAGQYCVYKWENPQKHCHRCRLRRNFAINVPIVTYEEIEKMVPEDACGYWAQESSLDRYDIVLGHYGRLPRMNINVLLVDEAHEFYLPHIVSYNLYEVATLLGVNVGELNLDVIRELVEERLLYVNDPLAEDKLWSLRNALRKTCWIENEALNCLDTYNLPRGIRTFTATATPPPGWPPEEWGEKIVIKPKIKPKAYVVEPEVKFYYKDRYEGAALMLHLVVNWLRRSFGIDDIAVFATSSLRQVLHYSLPPGVQLFPSGG